MKYQEEEEEEGFVNQSEVIIRSKGLTSLQPPENVNNNKPRTPKLKSFELSPESRPALSNRQLNNYNNNHSYPQTLYDSTLILCLTIISKWCNRIEYAPYQHVRSRYLDFKNQLTSRQILPEPNITSYQGQSSARPRKIDQFGPYRGSSLNRSPSLQSITRSKLQIDQQSELLNLYKIICSKAEKTIVFQEEPLTDTYSYLRYVTSDNSSDTCFIQHTLNRQLRNKILNDIDSSSGQLFTQRQSALPSIVGGSSKSNFYKSKHSAVSFETNFEASNLCLAAAVPSNQYDLFIRVDTHSKGHQNWFNFRVQSQNKKTIKFNIINIKRTFGLYREGLRPFVAIIDSKGIPKQWEQQGTHVTFGQKILYVDSQQNKQVKANTLSFRLELKAGVKYQVAMLPSYTYSDVLNLVNHLQSSSLYSNFLTVQTFTESLTGLALPILTLTNKISKLSEQQKSVILVSGRIHPGETVASFIVHGIIQSILSSANQELLDSVIFKIIPMLNPDGVVFGNFRTSFLGVDMNRSFHKSDEILYPEVVNLKKLGWQLREKYKQRFLCYFDIHGHSTQKNIFTYGPDLSMFMHTQLESHQSKAIPKLIAQHCKYFKYNLCTFKLQESKLNTARGFFLKNIRTMAYTLESSYGLYEVDNQLKKFRVEDWVESGRLIVDALRSYIIGMAGPPQRMISLSPLRQMPSKSERGIIRVLKSSKKPVPCLDTSVEPKSATLPGKQIRKQASLQLDKEETDIPDSNNEVPHSQSHSLTKTEKEEESDNDDPAEDLSETQRKQFEKRIYMAVLQSQAPSKTVEKQAIIYPLISPTLYRQKKQDEITVRLLQQRKGGLNSLVNAQKKQKIIRQLESLSMIQPHQRNMIHFG